MARLMAVAGYVGVNPALGGRETIVELCLDFMPDRYCYFLDELPEFGHSEFAVINQTGDWAGVSVLETIASAAMNDQIAPFD